MSICTGCCTTLDHIVTYVFKQLLLKGKYSNKINKVSSMVMFSFFSLLFPIN